MSLPILVVVNGKYARSHERTLNVSFGRLQKGGIAVKVVETRGPQDASRIVKQAFEQGQRQFISAGGDGTSFEIINGLFPQALGQNVSLGFIPLGTGNSFVQDYSDQEERYTVEAIVRGRKQAIDVIELTCEEGVYYFINILSLGLVADIGAFRNRFFSRCGRLGYVLSVLLRSLGTQATPIAFSTQDHTNESPLTFVSFCNSRYTGGDMLMAPKARLDDGKIDVICAGPMGMSELIKSFPTIFKGTHVQHPKVSYMQSETVVFQNPQKQTLMIDGEHRTLTPKSIKVLKKALTVLL